MKKTISILLIVILAFSLVACSSDKKDEKVTIIGSWQADQTSANAVYTFNEDGTGNYEFAGAKMDFTYTDTGSAVSITYTGNTQASTYNYTIEGDKLNISDSFGQTVVYTKK